MSLSHTGRRKALEAFRNPPLPSVDKRPSVYCAPGAVPGTRNSSNQGGHSRAPVELACPWDDVDMLGGTNRSLKTTLRGMFYGE